MTYYQQKIALWEKHRRTIQKSLQVTQRFDEALQAAYPSVKKHWDFIQSTYTGIESTSDFKKFYDKLRKIAGVPSVMGSETTVIEQKLYDHFKDIFADRPPSKEEFYHRIKALWEDRRQKDPAFEKIQKKFQEDFVRRALKQFQDAEKDYQNSPSSEGKKRLLSRYAAKLIAVMTLADDQYGVGLRKGIPENWLNNNSKEDLLRRAELSIRLADNLLLSEQDKKRIEEDYNAMVNQEVVNGITLRERQRQEEKFYQKYLKQPGLELEFACEWLAKPYRDEIAYYQNIFNAHDSMQLSQKANEAQFREGKKTCN